MTMTLVAWLGHTDVRAAQGDPAAGQGPIARAVADRGYEQLILLSTLPAEEAAAYAAWLLAGYPCAATTIHDSPLDDPTDHGAIHTAATEVCDEILQLDPDTRLVFHLSPGTPAMAAVWLLLARTRYAAELVQSSPEAGVQTVVVPFDISAEFLPDVVRRREQAAADASVPAPAPPAFTAIKHRSTAMHDAVTLARQVAPFDVPVLLLGETGTGKELLARAIHAGSQRADLDLVTVNCAAMPDDLLEAALFGHTKGAFTGADAQRDGYLTHAHNATLFLDEIGELSTRAQKSLLRVLQDGTFRPVGSDTERQVDVRLIAATNRDLQAEVGAGTFREDLYYRIAVGQVTVPPLRLREGDVGLLADHFLAIANATFADVPGFSHKELSAGARNVLVFHPWPGNVRELEHVIQRAAIWSAGATVTEAEMRAALISPADSDLSELLKQPMGPEFSITALLHDIERHFLKRALRATHGNKTRASEILGLGSYQTLSNRMEKLGVTLPGDGTDPALQQGPPSD
jgi:transcriptional regulator with PAS, ATPase and Fis domain